MAKTVYAKLKNSLISAQKVRLVADLIRGKHIADAESILRFTNKTAAKDVFKALNSAAANAVHNEGWDRKELKVVEIFVDEAQTYKRGRPAARGRYRSILKRNCHITVGVQGKVEEKTVAKEKVAVKKEDKKVQAKPEVKSKISKKVIKKK
jgi:large subunit ribosomal protein L22